MTVIFKSNQADELKQATFIVMVPNEVDLHGDITSEDEVRKACHSFNRFSRQPNLLHIAKTTTFDFAESFIAPVDMNIEGNEIKKGTWLATVQVYDDGLWELIKSGEINGLSVGCLANYDELGD